MEQAYGNDLLEPSTWANMDRVHEIFSNLRSSQPIHLSSHPDYPSLWHVTKHADIFEIETATDKFLNEPRLNINTLAQEEETRQLTGGSLSLLHTLVNLDAPEHMKLRVLTQGWFMPKNLKKLQPSIDDSCSRQIERMISAQGPIDFASDIALEYPLRVIMRVLGVEDKDFPLMLRLTQEMFGVDDPDMKRKDSSDLESGLAATVAEFATFFQELTMARQANPQDDAASLIANAVIDGEPLSFLRQLGYYIIIATAGHDTTSYSLTAAVHQLALHPDIFDRLKEDPEEQSKKITEEAIRYASAVRHFIRTAKCDVEIRGKTIREGESVILWYPSGSRDEDVFEDPHTFAPERETSTRHAAFGHGPHMCLGMYLARQEITTFLRMMAKTVKSIELAGEPKFVQANFVGGIKSLPLKVVPQ